MFSAATRWESGGRSLFEKIEKILDEVIESLDERQLVPQFLFAFLDLYVAELRKQATEVRHFPAQNA